MKSNVVFLTPLVKKVIIGFLFIFFIIKVNMITGWELSDYKKVIIGTNEENVVHLESIQHDRANYYNLLRMEMVNNLINGKSLENSVFKLKTELSKPSLKKNDKLRHEILVLSSSALLSVKDYAMVHGIAENDLKLLQSLFKDYASLDVEFSAGILKRNRFLFVPGREEVLTFLLPVTTPNSLREDKKILDESLKDFKKL